MPVESLGVYSLRHLQNTASASEIQSNGTDSLAINVTSMQ